jgi:hypothetical protein
MLSHGAFGTDLAIRDRGNFNSLEWWNMHDNVSPQLQRLATPVLSHVVNTYCVERCWSTYNFIHTIKRNMLNETVGRIRDSIRDVLDEMA